MSRTEKDTSNLYYLNIVQGSLRQSVPKGTEGAVEREWEAGGKKGVKYEIPHTSAIGYITDIKFHDGEKDGRKFSTLNITLDENENGNKPVICTNVSTRYCTDILKKLPNVDLSREVKIRPYSFQPEGQDKSVIGVEITQQDKQGQFTKKIDSFFHAKNGEGKWFAKENFPEPQGDTSTYDSDDWDIYYKQARKFLINYTKENIIPKLSATEKALDEAFDPKSDDINKFRPNFLKSKAPAIEYPREEINPEDVPF